MSFNAEQIAYLNEKNISSDMVYADFLLLDASTKRALCIPKDPPVFTADSGKSFTEVYAGYLNDDPTDNTFHVWMFADGSGSLTPEQSLYLKERYNLANLTWDEYKRYLGDLTTFNVLSMKEYAHSVFSKEQSYLQDLMVEAGLLPEEGSLNIKTYIPDGVFNLYDYLVEEFGKALQLEKLNKAYDVNSSTFISSCYEKLIKICDQL